MGKIMVFTVKMREKGCVMSGAAARTGNYNEEQKKIIMESGYKALVKKRCKMLLLRRNRSLHR